MITASSITSCGLASNARTAYSLEVLKPIQNPNNFLNLNISHAVRKPLQEKRYFSALNSQIESNSDKDCCHAQKKKAVFDIVYVSNSKPVRSACKSGFKNRVHLKDFFENTLNAKQEPSGLRVSSPVKLDCAECIERHSVEIKEQVSSVPHHLDDHSPIDSSTLELLITQESKYMPDAHYFECKQTHLTKYMRTILVDWMMEVCFEYKLKRETFYLSINYLDRYLSAQPNILKTELQLIGASFLFIAAKLEEIYPPKVSDFSKSTDNGFTSEQIVDMELKICKVKLL